MQFGVNGLSASVSECAAFSSVAAKAVSAAMLAIVLGMVGTALVTIGRAGEGGRVAVPVAGQIALVLLAWFTAFLMGAGTSC
jgi:hypothetical protein